jgi:exodeoxyribonuclease VII small subunit
VSGHQEPAPVPGEATTFEEALARLDDIVARLESGSVGLEEAVELFERGRLHLRVCQERLAAAQGRIEELLAEDLPGDEPPAESPL